MREKRERKPYGYTRLVQNHPEVVNVIVVWNTVRTFPSLIHSVLPVFRLDITQHVSTITVQLYIRCFTLGFSWRFRLYFRDLFEAVSEMLPKDVSCKSVAGTPFAAILIFFRGVFQAPPCTQFPSGRALAERKSASIRSRLPSYLLMNALVWILSSL
jgi:hypothetical protein